MAQETRLFAPNHRMAMKNPHYTRGDKVWWWSDVSGKEQRSKAVFLRYDHEREKFGDCILVINIGTKKHPLKQAFRWPTRMTRLLIV